MKLVWNAAKGVIFITGLAVWGLAAIDAITSSKEPEPSIRLINPYVK